MGGLKCDILYVLQGKSSSVEVESVARRFLFQHHGTIHFALLRRQLSLVRLFNCEMFFGEMELQLLEQELKEAPHVVFVGGCWRVGVYFWV